VKPLTDQELTQIESELARLAPAAADLKTLLGQALPRLASDLRAARTEAESLKGDLAREKSARAQSAREAPPAAARPSRSTAVEETEDAGAFLAAPFRVSAKAAAAARSDPLAALAVQVAKALAPDAGPVEQARLIAMAFAASQGDVEAFWAARRQRKVAPPTSRKKPLREP